jgi:hypothetical protein
MSNQSGWRWCHKCQGAFYAGGASQGVCPANHRTHDGSMSAHYATVVGDAAQGQQGRWRWCHQCQGMFHLGSGHTGGICPAGLAHDASQSAHYAIVSGDGAEGQQGGWRWCQLCEGMFYAGGPTEGICPTTHKAHDGSASAHYAAIIGDAGVIHDGSRSSHYAMLIDVPLPASVTLDSGSITSGLSIGGFARLAMTSGGDFTFSGHMHDSGALGINFDLGVVAMTPSGIAYTMKRDGHTAGTFTSGSRDDDWTTQGFDERIRDNWAEASQATLSCRLYASDSLTPQIGKALEDALQDALKAAGKTAVEAVIALI